VRNDSLGPVPDGVRVPGGVARSALLCVTILGTMSNNIINVPLRAIADDFDRPIATAVLSVSAFVLVLAVAMPLAGWLGDRIGQKQTLTAALALMVAAQAGAFLAPSLEALIALRALQGLACSAIPPMVMGMLAALYPSRKMRMMGAWAAANGIGQALGPPVGGLISDAWGWRAVFACMGLATLVTLVVILRGVPRLPTRRTSLHVGGALTLTLGMSLLLLAVTFVSQAAIPRWVDAAVFAAGLLFLVGYVLVSRGQRDAMVPVRLIVESRFLRSSAAAFAQMFALGTVLVALPLFFTGPLELSATAAGLLFFTLPMVMAVSAPLVSRIGERSSPRLLLRTGLGVIVLGSAVTGWLAARPELLHATAWMAGLLLVLGVGMAMVQTPAASGATRSPAGAHGAALGMFNMLRFSGTTAAAAWVALMFGHSMFVLFLGCAAVAALGLAMSFVGPNPPQDEAAPAPSSEQAVSRH